MGQQPPKAFPPPGEYRGTGTESSAVSAAQPGGIVTNGGVPAPAVGAISLAQSPQVPLVQSPQSTTTQSNHTQPIQIGLNGGTAAPVSPYQPGLGLINPSGVKSYRKVGVQTTL